MATPPITLLGWSADSPTFTVQVGNENRTYKSSKEGRRQAILDGLAVLETVTVEDHVYLPADTALQLVAYILYPQGIQTEEQYETVCRTTDKACAFAGWGGEEQLGPPVVPFSKRGAYRKREPAVDQSVVLEALEGAGISSYAPQQQVNCRIVWNKLAWEVYGKPLNNLTGPQLERLRLQADAVAEAAGWRIETEGSSASYVHPLPPNLEGARQAVVECLAAYNGHPVRVDTVRANAERGAYGRAFYADDLDQSLDALVRQVLAEQGYDPEPAGGSTGRGHWSCWTMPAPVWMQHWRLWSRYRPSSARRCSGSGCWRRRGSR